jgi:hypothetical protein
MFEIIHVYFLYIFKMKKTRVITIFQKSEKIDFLSNITLWIYKNTKYSLHHSMRNKILYNFY